MFDKFKGDLRDVKPVKFPVYIEDKKYFVKFNYEIVSEMAEEFCNGGSLEDVRKFIVENKSVDKEIAILAYSLKANYGEDSINLAKKIDNYNATETIYKAFRYLIFPPNIFSELHFGEDIEEKKTTDLIKMDGAEI